MTKGLAAFELNIQPPLIAHRGASASAPENTLAAFKKAQVMGARWLEFDVRLTACGELVVFHDETLDRTTNGSGKLDEQPYSYLQTLDAGSWFDPHFAGEKIPTLKMVFEFLAQHSLSANIELKVLPGQEGRLVTQILSCLDCYWPENLPAPLLSSFSLELLKILRAQAPSCRLGFLLDAPFPDWKASYQKLGASSLNLNQALLEPTTLELFKIPGQPLLAYTVNDPSRALELFSWGVDAIFTDCPDKILSVI